MCNVDFGGVACFRSVKIARSLASCRFALIAVTMVFTGTTSVAQDSKTPSVLPAPSTGKTIVCIYPASQ